MADAVSVVNLSRRDVSDRLDLTAAPSFLGDVAAVGITADGRVVVFNRGSQRVVILDPDGRYLRGWGTAEEYQRPHGLSFTGDGHLLLVDAGSHVVDKVSLDGELLLRIGAHGRPSGAYSGLPFNQPTDVVEHPSTGELFVSDGYANSSIHRFDSSGRHIMSWGSPGTGPHELSNPHGLCLVDEDHLAVCDRENYRIQFFSLDGDLVDSWHWHHPSSIRRGADGNLYIAELGPPIYMHGVASNMGCCVCVVTPGGTVLERIGAPLPGLGPGQLLAPHGIAVGDDGDVYVGEVNAVYLTDVLRQTPAKEDLVCLRRWTCRD